MLESLLCAFIIFIITYTLNWLIRGNRDFFKIIDAFQKKLPPKQKKAKKELQHEHGFTILDVSQMSTTLNTGDLDFFIKQLEDFDYERIIFKKKQIKTYSENIQRLLTTGQTQKFVIASVQHLLESLIFQNTKPYLLGPSIYKIIKF